MRYTITNCITVNRDILILRLFYNVFVFIQSNIHCLKIEKLIVLLVGRKIKASAIKQKKKENGIPINVYKI